MKYKCRRIALLLLIILLVTTFFPFSSPLAANQTEKHILIIGAFTPDYLADQLNNKGFKNTLDENSKYEFSYSYEYLDIARFSKDSGYFSFEAKYLKEKYEKHQPDFIFCDFNSYPLFEQNPFPDVPVIMEWNVDKEPIKELDSNFYVIKKSTKIDENIQLILNNNPLTKKIYIVIGDSIGEQKLLQKASAIFSKYSSEVEFVLTNKLPYEQMLEQIGNAENDSAVLYLQWFSDVEGKSFVGAQVAQAVIDEATVPVYVNVIQSIGTGAVGGYVTDIEIVGETAANTLLNILAGGTPDSVVDCMPYRYVFDWRELEKWDIDEHKLSEGSRIEYRELSLWEQYSRYIIGVIVLAVLQSTLILVLLINNRKRRSAEKELIVANTSLQEMTEKLVSLDKVKDEFLTSTSHEMQTPLNGIINISQTLIEGRYGSINQRQKEELQIVLAVSKKLSSLINDIIDIEKIKRNEIQLNLTSFNIKSAADIVVDVLSDLIQSKDIVILNNIPDDLSPVLADENRLCQVLFNLVGNAVKFTERGNITISVLEDEGFVKVFIVDTGIGISKEKQSGLFNAFTQGDADIPKQYGGSGLGLYISRQLLERMGGHVFLEWSEQGKGTCVSFTIPKSNEQFMNKEVIPGVKPVTVESAETDQSKLQKGFKILAVDDDATNLRVLKSLLTFEGYEVLTALSGLEALEILKKQHDIDLVLMDLMMPKMSGLEACRKIRDRYSLYDLPLLILTVRNTPEDIVAGFEAGANDFVVKPFVAKELRARVATLLFIKESVRESMKNELAFLQAQIKPHFLFNAISTIMSFCYTDGEKAAELLGHLSEYLQKSFHIESTEETVSLEHELELTTSYIEIEKARFGERLTVEYDVDENILKQRILPLTIQPLVENAIRHGLMARRVGGRVRVSAKKEMCEIEIAIEDNGTGIQDMEALLIKTEVNHIGLSNIKKRLFAYYGTELHIDSEINAGTKVHFSIPFKEEL